MTEYERGRADERERCAKIVFGYRIPQDYQVLIDAEREIRSGKDGGCHPPQTETESKGELK